MVRNFVTSIAVVCFSAWMALTAGAKTDSIPKPADRFVCGTSAERQRNVVMRNRYRDSLLRRQLRYSRVTSLLQAPAPSAAADFGNIAVLEDDGTLRTQYNELDLAGRSILFTPAGSATSYQVSARMANWISGNGTSLRLTDDSSIPVALNPGFTFFGKRYASVNVNSDGNLTFGEPDTKSTARDLGRFSSGPPRIGPLFSDLDPATGLVFYRREADGMIFIWQNVPNFDTSQYNTFSVKLFDNGTIEFVYGPEMLATEAICGIAPGNSQDGISAVDFAAMSAPEALSGTIAEVFTIHPELMETAVARKFYQAHGDDFDQLVVFLTFPYDMQGAYSYELNVASDVKGIGLDPVDDGAAYGSAGRLKSFVLMGGLDKGINGETRYPDDPYLNFMRTYNTVQLIAHEVGHRWLSFPFLHEGNLNTTSLLHPTDMSHWNFFFNAEASLMEGNQIVDRGAGLGTSRFVTSEVTNKFSDFDLYLMGMRDPKDVPPMFYVRNPTGAARLTGDSLPDGRANTFGGTRFDFSMDNIIAANGVRQPGFLQSQKVHRLAFILVSNPAYPATPQLITKLQRIHDAFVRYFSDVTVGQGWALTDLQRTAATTPADIYFPSFEGDTQRYTGFAVANWGSQPADVLFRAFDDTGTELVATDSVNPRMVTIAPSSQVAMLGEQIHNLSLDGKTRTGWIKAESSSSQVSGFFMEGDFAETFLDGAVADGKTDTWLCFTRARGTSAALTNRFVLVNPNSQQAHLVFKLFNPDGQQQGTQADVVLNANGRIARDLAGIFPGTDPNFRGYLTVASDLGVVGYESFQGSGTVFSLPAQTMSSAATLYSAQFASGLPGGPASSIRYFTDVNIVNASSNRRQVSVTLVGNNGAPIPGVVAAEFALEAGAQKFVRGEELFGLANALFAAGITEGSLVLTADGPGIIGDVSFGDPVSANFMAALPLDGTPRNQMVLSQVAQGVQGSGTSYFTGIAIYNPNPTRVDVTVEIYSEQGNRTGNGLISLGPGERRSQTLPQIVPGFGQQMRGYVRLNAAGGPVISFGIFGEASSVRFLAAIPPQAVRQ